MRYAALETQARLHEEWTVVLGAVAKTAYKLAENPSMELIQEIRALQVAEQMAKARFEAAMREAFDMDPMLLTETEELADPNQPTARINPEVVEALVRECRR